MEWMDGWMDTSIVFLYHINGISKNLYFITSREDNVKSVKEEMQMNYIGVCWNERN